MTNQRLTLSALVRAQNARSDDWLSCERERDRPAERDGEFGGGSEGEREGELDRSDQAGRSHLKGALTGRVA